MLFKTPMPIDTEKAQLDLKAEAIAEIVGDLGYEAVGLGETDLASGADFAVELGRKNGYAVLAANVTRADGSRPFGSHTIVDTGGIKVGIFGITNQIHTSFPGHKDLVQSDAHVAAREQVELLRKQGCRLIVCLSHLGLHADRQMVRTVEGIDVIVSGHSREMTTDPVMLGSSVIVQAYSQGKYVGRLDLELPRDRPESPYWVYVRQSDTQVDDAKAQVLRTSFKALDKNTGETPEVLERLKKYQADVTALAAQRASAEGQASPKPAGQDPGHGHAHGPAGTPGAAPPPIDTTAQEKSFTFWGAKLCSSCHVEQAEFWKKTTHSHAIEILRKKGRAFDMECIGCHTTGFRQAGGFELPEKMGGFENVQCESCHGPGIDHGKGLMAKQASTEQTCVKCHDPHNSPEFDFELMLPMMSCPSMTAAAK